jgi:hypothetical protein
MRGIHEARGLRNRCGHPEPFVPEGLALREPPQFAIAPGEVGPGGHDGHVDLTEAFVVRRAIEERHRLPKTVDRPTVVTLGEVDSTEGMVRERVQDDIPTGRGELKDTLGRGNGLGIRPHDVETVGEKEGDLAQPTRVVEGRSKALGLAQIRQDGPPVARRQERRTQGEPEIDRLLACGACLRQMREGTECLFIVPDRLVVDRPCQGLLPRLPAVRHSFVPDLAP